MTAQPVEANVVLTTDNTQYDQAMGASAMATDNLGKSVDSLGMKLNNLAKSAGRKLIGVSVADVATITAATAAYGAWEHQMEGLNTQSAVLNKNMEMQKSTFNSYATSVNSVRSSFGETTAGAAALVQTLSKLQDNTTTVDKLATTFEKLGKTTQDSPQALAQGMLQLQRTMGTSQRDTEKYSNELAVLQARSDASATSILSFANSIAPLGRLVNMSQTDIMGWSNAFIKAGQDGMQAGNAFGTMVQNIAYATQSGSPELAKYANLVGMTVGQFKSLGASDQILRVFESINQQGPRAITTLNRMGLDGMRTVRAVSAMAQQPGGIAGELQAARGADQGAIDRGSETAMDGLTENLGKLRAELNQTAEAFGKNFAPAAGLFIKLLTMGAAAANSFMNSPAGKLAAWATATAIPIAALAGTVLLLAKALAAFAAINQVVNSGFVTGFRRQGAVTGATAGLGNAVMTEAELGRAGWASRGLFSSGARLSRAVGYGAVEREGSGALSRAVGWGLTGLGTSARFGGDVLYGGGVSSDWTRRPQMFSSSTARGSMAFMGPFGSNVRSGYTRFMSGASGDPAFTTRGGAPMAYAEAARINQNYDQLRSGRLSGLTSDAEKMKTAEAQAMQYTKNARAMAELEKSTMSASKGMGAFGRGMGSLLGSMTLTAGTAAKEGGGLLARGAGAIAGSGMMGVGAAGIGLFSLVSYLQGQESKTKFQYTDYQNALNPYYQAAGVSAVPTAASQATSPANRRTITAAGARNISVREAQIAQGGGYKPVNSAIPSNEDQAMTMLSGQWSYLSKTPSAVNDVAMDLTNKFGRDKAQKMLNALDQGGTSLTSPLSLVPSAARPGYHGGWGGVLTPINRAYGIQDAGRTSDLMNRAYGSLSDQYDYLSTQSPAQAARFRGNQYNRLIRGFSMASPDQAGTSVTGNFQQATAKAMFGLDLDQTSAESTFLTKGGGLKEYLQGAFGKGGYLGTDEDRRRDALSHYGIRNTDLTGDQAAAAVYRKIYQAPAGEPGDAKDAASQIKDATKELFGAGGILNLASVKKALSTEGDPVAQYRAINDVANQISTSGMGIGQQVKYLNRVSNLSAGDPAMGSDIAQQGMGIILQNAQQAQTYMGRGQQFGQQSQVFQGMMTGAMGPLTPDQRNQEKSLYQQQVQAQYSYFQQMLLMQNQYEISRTRAQDDYNLQRGYQEHDFNLQRSRAETDFQQQRQYATEDYNRSVRRANYQYNLQRRQAEADFNHQIEVSSKQMAMSVMDIYKRVDVQRTSSAEWILSNAQDQIVRMQEQESNLNKLRREGLSTNAIQQLKLTDPNNAQQVQSLVNDLNPRLIRQYNQMGDARVKAAKALGQDESDLGASETRRSFALSESRSQKAHDLSMRQGADDFARTMERQRKEFNKMMDRQSVDFDTAAERQHTAYITQMQRSADDLANVGKEITGDFEDILTQSVNHLTGHAQKQAEAVLRSYRHLKNSTSPVAVEMMTELAGIFGFKYTAPKGVNTVASVPTMNSPSDIPGRHSGTQPGYHTGGMVPGYTPDRDTQTIHVGGGEAIMRPEWARAVGRETIDQMNHQARHGGFAKGGVVWPLPNSTWSTYPGHDGIDLNSPNDLGKPFYAAVPGRISYTGWNHGYGDAIFESGPYGTLVYGHGSKVAVHAGQMVSAGQYIGNVGSTGHSTGPHLHIGFPGGTSQEILSFLHGAGHTGYGAATEAGTGVTPGMLKKIFKDRYPAAERAAWAMEGAHPLNPGDISKVINRMGRDVMRRLRRRATGADPGPGSLGNEPSANLSNEGIVHVGANRMGWGDQWGDLRQIVMHESGFNNTAQNPTSTAYGMFQFLDGTWGNYGGRKTSDPWKQTQYGLQYIKDRYKDPHGAWNFWQDHNWYGDGAVFNKATTIGVGERGPEAVIPLNDRGGEFLTKAMLGVEARGVGMGSSPMRGGISVYNTRIDKSTNFTGPITVQANDPGELLAKLQARQRVMALSRPALTGSAA
jgi:TP901 family phage tail tape measure protein